MNIALGAVAGWLGSLLLHLHVLNYVVATIMILTALWMLGAISIGMAAWLLWTA